MTRIENLLLGEVGIGFDSSSDEDSIDQNDDMDTKLPPPLIHRIDDDDDDDDDDNNSTKEEGLPPLL